MSHKNNLFDTRGGAGKAGHCEVCDEPLDPDAVNPVCEDCSGIEDVDGH